MCRFTVITLAILVCERVLALSIDQRQAGDLNVQIDLKNFNVFALTKGKEEYVDYDYAYDYSEMTIKPQNGTSTTIKPLNTTQTVVQSDKDNATVTSTELELTTKITENNESITERVVTETTTNILTTKVATTTVRLEPPTTVENLNTTVLDCKKGFFRNTKGYCELILQNPSNTLLKMLQQKSKPGRGNDHRKP